MFLETYREAWTMQESYFEREDKEQYGKGVDRNA